MPPPAGHYAAYPGHYGGYYAASSRESRMRAAAEELEQQQQQQQQQVSKLSVLWTTGFERIDQLEEATEFADTKMSKLLQCFRLTQSFVEENQQEQAAEHEAVREELSNTKVVLARTRQQLSALGAAMEAMQSKMQLAVPQAVREHASSVEHQMAEMRDEMREICVRGASEMQEAQAAATASLEARLGKVEEGLAAQARGSARLLEELEAQREALGKVGDEVAVHCAGQQEMASVVASALEQARPAPALPSPSPPFVPTPLCLPSAQGLAGTPLRCPGRVRGGCDPTVGWG